MSRVSTHAVKQASLNLKDMVDKKQLGVELTDIATITSSSSSKVWESEEEKPECITSIIDQIKGLFNVGTEVESWTVSYYPPPQVNPLKKGCYTPTELRIPAGSKGLGSRFVLMIGSRDIINLSLAVGKTDAETAYMILSGDCVHLKITICPVMDIYFNNTSAEKLAPRKGFRETVVRKNIQNRHVFVFDANVDSSAVMDKVKSQIFG